MSLLIGLAPIFIIFLIPICFIGYDLYTQAKARKQRLTNRAPVTPLVKRMAVAMAKADGRDPEAGVSRINTSTWEWASADKADYVWELYIPRVHQFMAAQQVLDDVKYGDGK